MYEPLELLETIDDNKWWILGLFTICMTFQWIWLIECVRLAKRERVYTMPLFCTFYWFAHDIGCVVRFDEWFNTYDHWYLKCFWFGLLTAAILEIIFFSQVLKYGKDELLPGVTAAQFIGGLVAIQLAAIMAWEFFKYALDDPLYQFSPAPTMISYPLFGFALMLRRRSTIGQNVTMWLAFTGMCVFWFPTAITMYGDAFNVWQYYVAGIISITGGLVMAYLVSDKSQIFRRVPLTITPPADEAELSGATR